MCFNDQIIRNHSFKKPLDQKKSKNSEEPRVWEREKQIWLREKTETLESRAEGNGFEYETSGSLASPKLGDVGLLLNLSITNQTCAAHSFTASTNYCLLPPKTKPKHRTNQQNKQTPSPENQSEGLAHLNLNVPVWEVPWLANSITATFMTNTDVQLISQERWWK